MSEFVELFKGLAKESLREKYKCRRCGKWHSCKFGTGKEASVCGAEAFFEGFFHGWDECLKNMDLNEK